MRLFVPKPLLLLVLCLTPPPFHPTPPSPFHPPFLFPRTCLSLSFYPGNSIMINGSVDAADFFRRKIKRRQWFNEILSKVPNWNFTQIIFVWKSNDICFRFKLYLFERQGEGGMLSQNLVTGSQFNLKEQFLFVWSLLKILQNISLRQWVGKFPVKANIKTSDIKYKETWMVNNRKNHHLNKLGPRWCFV